MKTLSSALSRALAVLTAAMLIIAAVATPARAQKALVYCPAGTDATGCTNTVNALAPIFPDGVDRGFDGSSGTINLRTADLWSYSVLVIPSLATTNGVTPYSVLADTAMGTRLKNVILGKVALWSGTPDQGSPNGTAKDTLIQNLAKFARGNYAQTRGPGLVVLQDLSDSTVTRYSWLERILGTRIVADTNLASYSSVDAQNDRARGILSTAAGLPISYANMASFGFIAPGAGSGFTVDAVGRSGTTQIGQNVMLTSPGGNSGMAVITSDKDDYAPGTVVTLTGSGFAPGETVAITLVETPYFDSHPAITVVADGAGSFVNTSFSPDEHDIGIRFIVTAIGRTSGVRAVTSFTDGNISAAANYNTYAASTCASGGTPATTIALSGSPATGAVCYRTDVNFQGSGKTKFSVRWYSGAAPAALTELVAVADSSTGGAPVTISHAVSFPSDIAASAGGTSASYTVQVCSGQVGQSCGSTYGTVSFTVSSPLTKQNQTITFVAPSGLTYTSSDTELGATSSSGLAVTYSSSTPATCSINGTKVHVVAVGSCTVTASQSGNASFNPATDVTQTFSIGKASQAITFSALSAKTWGDADFTLGATASSGLAVTYSVGATDHCTVSGSTVHLTGAGNCSVTAAQAGDGNYNAATSVTQSFTINKATATISLAGLSATYDGTAKSVTATTTPAGLSGVAITYNLSATPPTNAGSYAVVATLTNDNYQATDASGTLVIGQASQSITFGALGAKTFGDADFTVSATASSGLPVTYSVGATDNCTISGNTVHITGAGSCSVTAAQGGNNNYTAAASVTQTFRIAKAAATITLSNLTPTYDGSAKSVTVTTNPANLTGVSVTYDGSPTAPTTAGSYAVVASLTNANYQAQNATGTLVIGQANQAALTLSGVPSTAVYQSTFTVTPGGGSGTASLVVSVSGVCSVSGNTVTMTSGTGNCTVAVDRAGDTNYKPATQVTAVAAASKASQTISFGALGGKTYGDAAFTVSATASSSLAVSFTAGTTDNCSISGNTVTLTGAGTCTVTAAQSGDDNYASATSVAQTFSIAKAASTTTVSVSNATYDGNSHGGTASVTGFGGLSQNVAVTYVGRNGTSYGPSGTAPTNAGDYTASASFAGDANHDGSQDSKDFSIAKAHATITLSNLTPTFDGTPKSATATTSPDGLAGVAVTYDGSATAPTNAGSYAVVATLTNGNYDAPQATGTLVIAKAASQTQVTCPSTPQVFTGSAQTPCSAAVTGAGGLSATVAPTYTNNVHVGTASANASFGGDANHEASSGSATFTISKASSTTAVTASNATYDGQSHGATATATGAGGLSTAVTAIDYTGTTAAGAAYSSSTAPTDAGDYVATATFAGDDDHTGSTGHANFSIAKATPSVTATGGSFTYDGTAHAGSGSVTGVGGVALTPAATLTYVGANGTTYASSTTPPVDAGDYTVTASFAGNDNYTEGTSTAASLTIAKANATINVVGFTGTYDGSAHGATGSATGVGGTDLSSLLSLGDSFTSVPGGTANWSFAGNNNYNAATGSVPITINKASSTTTVTVGNATYDGNAHGGTANVTGAGSLSQSLEVSYVGRNTTVYGPTATAPTNAGDYTASASFGGDDNHISSSDSKGFSIAKASSTTALTCPISVTYNGTAQTPCTASSTGAGGLSTASTLAYSNNTNAGTASVTATYAGDANHDGSSDTKTFTIAKATPTVTAVGGNATYDGAPHAGSGAAVGVLNENLGAVTLTYAGAGYGPTPVAPTNAGTYSVVASIGETTNYVAGQSTAATLTIAKAQATVNVTGYTGIYDGRPHGATGSASGVMGEDLSSLLNLGATYTNVPGGPANWSFTGNVNYLPKGGTVNIVIAPWTFDGFYQPVTMGALNSVKGGSTVPLKFNVYTDPAKTSQITDVAKIASITARGISCPGGTEVPADTIATATGGTQLRFDGTQFIYNWQTPKTTGCYELTLTTVGNSILKADFKLK